MVGAELVGLSLSQDFSKEKSHAANNNQKGGKPWGNNNNNQKGGKPWGNNNNQKGGKPFNKGGKNFQKY